MRLGGSYIPETLGLDLYEFGFLVDEQIVLGICLTLHDPLTNACKVSDDREIELEA
jgi:hypothetical protein